MPVNFKFTVDKRSYEKVQFKLRAYGLQHRNCSVVVGYSAPYAIFVHEDLTVHHPVGRAKYLEEPMRAMRPTMKVEMQALMKRHYTIKAALLAIGRRLQAASQMIVPVDTGFLRSSAFTRLDKT